MLAFFIIYFFAALFVGNIVYFIWTNGERFSLSDNDLGNLFFVSLVWPLTLLILFISFFSEICQRLFKKIKQKLTITTTTSVNTSTTNEE